MFLAYNYSKASKILYLLNRHLVYIFGKNPANRSKARSAVHVLPIITNQAEGLYSVNLS